MDEPELTYEFCYTLEEFNELQSINGIQPSYGWLSIFTGLLCLAPTICLLSLVLPLYGTAVVLLGGLAFSIYVWRLLSKVSKKPLDLPIRFDFYALTRIEWEGHCRSEIVWEYNDEFIESEHLLLYRRLQRYTGLPKRVIPPAELARAIELSERSNQKLPSDSPAVPLYDRLLDPTSTQPTSIEPRKPTSELTAGEADLESTTALLPKETAIQPFIGRQFPFTYRVDDLYAASQNRFHSVELQTAVRPTPNRRATRFVWTIVLVILLVLVIRWPGGPGPLRISLQWWQVACVFAAILSPLLTFKLWSWIVRTKAAVKRTDLPREQQTLALLSDGWVIGNRNAFAFFDWRDVTTIYQNNVCFGFQINQGLVQVIPKRIFKSAGQMNDFIETAVLLRRDRQQKFVQPSLGVETGNPFQAPID